MAAQLPQELVDDILEFVRLSSDSKPSLLSSLLVSRTWSQSAERALYHDVEFRSGVARDYRIHRTLSNNDRLTKHVRCLSLKVSMENSRICSSLLGLCTNVDELSLLLDDVDGDYSDSICTNLTALCGTLKKLTVNDSSSSLSPGKLFFTDGGYPREWLRLEFLELSFPIIGKNNPSDLGYKNLVGRRTRPEIDFVSGNVMPINCPSLRRLDITIPKEHDAFFFSCLNAPLCKIRIMVSTPWNFLNYLRTPAWFDSLEEFKFNTFIPLVDRSTITFPEFPSVKKLATDSASIPASIALSPKYFPQLADFRYNITSHEVMSVAAELRSSLLSLLATSSSPHTHNSGEDTATSLIVGNERSHNTQKLKRFWLSGWMTFDMWKDLREICEENSIEFEYRRMWDFVHSWEQEI